ncbi:MAG: high-affinity zinc transporter membrane component [Methanomassiliicoccales archaeon PtaU1.Bin124]|nr:MAG: high-affinity zinc transporter membrane component [Methanomassiliicoccales archaeon PtaU1.Bin124]
MNALEALIEMFSFTFVQNGLIGGVAAALICAMLGVFIALKRASLIGEGLAHLSFGGIAVGLFAGIYPLYTALLLALLGTVAISYLQKKRLVYYETAIGIIFSFGLALGAVLASMSGGFNVDLFSYLFGDILTISYQDLALVVMLTVVVVAFTLLFYKEMMQMTFDEQGARLAGVPTGLFDMAFNIMTALAVVVSIKIVGSLLVSSLLIIPAASALQITRSFRTTVVYSAAISVFCVVFGLFASFFYDIATGGAIVLINILVFVILVISRKFFVKTVSIEEDKPCD